MDIKEEYTEIMDNGGYKALTNKIVLKITGNPIKLLHGISTNTEDASKNALIDRFGKLVILFDQKIIDSELYIVFEKQFENRFNEHMKNYLLLNKSKAEKTGLNVFHVIGNKDFEGIKIPQRIGYLFLTKDASVPLKEISDETYNTIRIENDISVQGIDFDQEMLLNTNWQDAVSFTKGCFLGQEIMARVHNLGRPPKKLARITYEKLPEKITSDGKEVGKAASKCFSPKHGKYIVFSFLPTGIEKIDDGTLLN